MKQLLEVTALRDKNDKLRAYKTRMQRAAKQD
jgi:hypothetical protein